MVRSNLAPVFGHPAARVVPALALAALAFGCGGGGGSSKGTSAGGGGSSGGSQSGPTLTITETPGLPASFEVRYDLTDAAVSALDVSATGVDVLVRSVVLKASGSGEDAADVAGVRLAIDDGDGLYDPATDQAIGGVARFNQDNGTAVLGGLQHTVLSTALAPERWWVVYDFAGTATPGKTFHVDLVAATDVDAEGTNGRAVNIAGLPAHSPEAVVFMAEHLMLSEINVTPTQKEFIEVFNPTAQPIDLSEMYLTDGEDRNSTPQQHYYNIPTGHNFGLEGPSRANDFTAHFPAGATIQPGQYVTIAFDSVKFAGSLGLDADYEFTQDGTADGVPDMVWPAGFAPTSATLTAGLSNDRELVILFRWDGRSDLVDDVDMVEWGDAITAFYVDKSTLSIDGPDQDTTATPYKADQTMLLHDKARPNDPDLSMKRVDYAEFGEIHGGGNGALGHDETSENWSISWQPFTPPTPGTK